MSETLAQDLNNISGTVRLKSGTGLSRPFTFYLNDHPAYEPLRWEINQTDNNCYNYALNVQTGYQSRMKPGFLKETLIAKEHIGVQYDQFDWRAYRDQVISGAQKDGLIYLGHTPELQPNHRLIALAIKESPDFHWYRLDNNGFWSHKLSVWDPERMEEENELNPFHSIAQKFLENQTDITIKCPDLMCLEPYKHFAGYFLVPNDLPAFKVV